MKRDMFRTLLCVEGEESLTGIQPGRLRQVNGLITDALKI